MRGTSEDLRSPEAFRERLMLRARATPARSGTSEEAAVVLPPTGLCAIFRGNSGGGS